MDKSSWCFCYNTCTPWRENCLNRQFRYAVGSEFIELPAGKLDPGESPLECAKRELEEEIGYKSNKIEFIANIHPAIGFANQKMHLFLAKDLVQTKQNKDADEFIDLMPANLEKALELVWSNKITDVKTIIGILVWDIFSSRGQSFAEQLATFIKSNFIFSIISTDSSSKGVQIV